MNYNFSLAINKVKNNIFKISLPYYIFEKRRNNSGTEEKWAIFWGKNFKVLPEINGEKFMKQTNLCLDFVRRECADCKLLYKPHPAETDEPSMINLDGFEITKEKTVSEFFIFKNFSKIKFVFSAFSAASITARSLGLNSYTFLPLFESTMVPATRESCRAYFSKMPPDFFISDLNLKLRENKLTFTQDQATVSSISEVLSARKGMVWFILGDPGFLTSVIAIKDLIGEISPGRKVGLIIERHHRWDIMNMSEVSGYFDSIISFPRSFYSLRPGRILRQIKTVLAIRKLKFSPDDILIGCNCGGLVENSLISFFSRNLKISLISKSTFELCYGTPGPSFFETYFPRAGAIFSNKILEPLLGLNRMIFFEDRGRAANFNRYQRPLNDVYDKVLVF